MSRPARYHIRKVGVVACAKFGCAGGALVAVPFGLLVCAPALVHFYHKLGWQTVDGPLICDQPASFQPGPEQVIASGPTHKVPLEGPIMVLPCRQEIWPAGLIDLCGFPW